MIKLSKLTDYAVVTMVTLAREAGTPRSAHYLAEKTGVPEPTVAKLLKVLVRENLLESSRGATGGYVSSRGLDQISVVEVITAIDGPIAIVSCIEDNDDACTAEHKCPIKGGWEPVNTAIKKALDNVKLSDLSFASCAHKKYDFMAENDASNA